MSHSSLKLRTTSHSSLKLRRPRTIYLVGNGQRSLESVKALKGRIVMGVTNSAFEMEEWGFRMNYWGSMEQLVHKKHYLKFLDDSKMLTKEMSDIGVFVSHWVKNYREILPHVTIKPRIEYNPDNPGKNVEGFQIFGSLGPNMAYICVKYLHFERIVLLGMQAHKEGFPRFKASHVRSWNRFQKWLNSNNLPVEVLNCSENTAIDCFPQPKLEDVLNGSEDL